jgi:hypothetical protein
MWRQRELDGEKKAIFNSMDHTLCAMPRKLECRNQLSTKHQESQTQMTDKVTVL